KIQIGNNITSIGSAETGTNNYNAVYQINERLTWLRGRRTLKFGGSWNYNQSESYYPGNNGQNGFISYTNFNFTGQAIGDFLLDQVSRKGKGSTSDAWTHLQHRVAFYAADDFKITDRLTLNLGLRWAYTSPFVEKDDRQASFDLTNGAQLRAWDSKIRPQFTQQGNLFIEYLLGPRSSINVGYVGSNSTNVINTIDANQPLPGTGDPRTWLPTQQRRPLYRFNPDITFLITTI